eukprot:4925945-Pyramimonas_sp.AAC.1
MASENTSPWPSPSPARCSGVRWSCHPRKRGRWATTSAAWAGSNSSWPRKASRAQTTSPATTSSRSGSTCCSRAGAPPKTAPSSRQRCSAFGQS